MQHGGLVVKMLACCARSPWFNVTVGNPKFSSDLHQQSPGWMLFRGGLKLAFCYEFAFSHVSLAPNISGPKYPGFHTAGCAWNDTAQSNQS